MWNIVVRHLEGLRSCLATKCTQMHTLRAYGCGMVNEFQLSGHMVHCCPPMQTKTEKAFNLWNDVVRHVKGLRRSFSCYKMNTYTYWGAISSDKVSNFQLSAHMVEICPSLDTKTEEVRHVEGLRRRYSSCHMNTHTYVQISNSHFRHTIEDQNKIPHRLQARSPAAVVTNQTVHNWIQQVVDDHYASISVIGKEKNVTKIVINSSELCFKGGR